MKIGSGIVASLYSTADILSVILIFGIEGFTPRAIILKEVVRVSKVTGNSKFYSVDVTQWGDYTEPMTIEIPLNQHGDMKIGMPVKVNLKEGLFHIPWYYVSL